MNLLIGPMAANLLRSAGGGGGFGIKNAMSSGRSGSGTSTVDFSSLSPAADDVLLILTQNVQSGTTMVSSGYTQAYAHGYTNSNSGAYAEAKAFWKTLAAETSVQLSGGPSNWFLFLLQGAHLTTPVEVVGGTASGNNTDRANPPAVTPSTDGALIFGWGGGGYTVSAALTDPGGYDSFYNRQQTSGGFMCNSAVGVKEWNTGDGAFDPPAFTGGANQFNSAWAAGTLAIRPA